MTSPHSAFIRSAQPQGTHPTRCGPVDLPILYRDASAISAVFRVPPARVVAALGNLRLEPVRIAGKSTVVLTVFTYRDTTVGPYNELAITSYVRPLDDRRFRSAAFWVHALPVTTPEACAAGLDIWGYPKWVAPIDYTQDGATIATGMPGELTLELSIGAAALPVPMKAPFSTLTELDGELIRTRVPSRSRMRFAGGRRAALRIIGPGRASELLDRLGCARPVFAFWCERFESILPRGTRLGPSRRDIASPSSVTHTRVKAS